MPPNVGSSAATMSQNLSTFFSAISRSNTSMSANFLNRHALPSITGLPAAGPMSPKPSTAVPFEITATRLPRAVYSQLASSFFAISRHGSATPGVYASDKSIWLTRGFVGTTSSFPLRPRRWYSSASSLRLMIRKLPRTARWLAIATAIAPVYAAAHPTVAIITYRCAHSDAPFSDGHESSLTSVDLAAATRTDETTTVPPGDDKRAPGTP